MPWLFTIIIVFTDLGITSRPMTIKISQIQHFFHEIEDCLTNKEPGFKVLGLILHT